MNQFYYLLFVFFVAVQVGAQDFKEVKDIPLHEAFAVQEMGTLVLEAAPEQPPAYITELQSQQTISGAVWIPGYWGWSNKHNQFFWVSGTWRRPPPGHHWVPGYWKNYPAGWTWIRGFWSSVDKDHLAYIANPPPDQIDAKSPPQPASADYFWVPGNWEANLDTKQYVWYSGRWEKLTPEWVFVPSHYVWREFGYVFLPGFWDWPVAERGLVFPPVVIDTSNIESFVYEPTNPLNELVVMQLLFPEWPNYAGLFQHHYHYNYDAWSAWGAAPPWWSWPTWWSFPWQDAWWLWWWWTHPGYPAPLWLDANLLQTIAPPPPIVVTLMQGVKPPANVTPSGVVGSGALLQAIHKVTDRNLPILPAKLQQSIRIQKEVAPHDIEFSFSVPQGTKQVLTPPQKPSFGPPLDNLKNAPKRVTLPPVPALNSGVPKEVAAASYHYPHSSSYSRITPYGDRQEQQQIIPQYPQQSPRTRYVTPLPPRTMLSPHTPAPNIQIPPPYFHEGGERAIPQPRRPMLYAPSPYTENELEQPTGIETQPQAHQRLSPAPLYRYEVPYQGYSEPSARRPRPSMESEHHDYMMTQPQPQRNPVGPEIDQVPGNYSTLPNQ